MSERRSQTCLNCPRGLGERYGERCLCARINPTMSLREDPKRKSQVDRLLANVERLGAEIVESEPPHTMAERAELLLAINKHFGIRLLFHPSDHANPRVHAKRS